jgi:hypothetical protein
LLLVDVILFADIHYIFPSIPFCSPRFGVVDKVGRLSDGSFTVQFAQRQDAEAAQTGASFFEGKPLVISWFDGQTDAHTDNNTYSGSASGSASATVAEQTEARSRSGSLSAPTKSTTPTDVSFASTSSTSAAKVKENANRTSLADKGNAESNESGGEADGAAGGSAMDAEDS